MPALQFTPPDLPHRGGANTHSHLGKGWRDVPVWSDEKMLSRYHADSNRLSITAWHEWMTLFFLCCLS